MAESTNDVLIRFRTESGNLKEELNSIESGLAKTDQTAANVGQTLTSQVGIVNNLRHRIEQLQKARDASFDPARIERINKLIGEASGRVAKLTTETAKFGTELKKTPAQIDLIGKSVKNLGSLVLAAFSVHQAIAFGKASFDAFTDAEKNAVKLKTAVGINGGLQKDFEELIKQAKELQKISIFSDEDIERAQTLALQYGLTNKQVKSLIPTIIDFASATGQDLQSATEAVIRGLEGQGRALKIYGIELDKNLNAQQQLASITDQLTAKFSGQAKVIGETTFGSVERLKNQFNDLQEEVGGFVADVGEATASLIGFVLNGFRPLNEEADKTIVKLDRVGKKIAETFNVNLFKVQLAQLRALPEGNAQAISALEEQIKKINFDKFTEEANKLDDKQIVEKVNSIKKTIGVTFNELNAEAEKNAELQRKIADETIKDEEAFAKRIAEIDAALAEQKRKNAEKILQENQKTANFRFTEPEDVTAEEELEILNQIIESRKIENKLLEDQNKIEEKGIDIAKDAKERSDAQLALAKFTFDQLSKNIDNESALQKLAAEEQINDETKLQLEILKITEKGLRDKLRVAEDTVQPIEDIEKQITENLQAQVALRKKLHEEEADERESITEQQIKQADELQDRFDKIEKELEEAAQAIRDNITASLGAIGDATNEIASLFEALNAQRIDEINKEKDEQIEAFDEEIEALEEKNNRGRISDEALEKRKKELIAQRTAAEKAADSQVRTLKRRQAEADKQLAIFNIIINTAAAVVKALPNVVLAALAGALGAIQLGVAIATPIPAFAKGTKKKKGSGLAYVGEEGPELTFLPSEAKVLPHGKTKKYGEFIDAMFDDRLEKYVYDNYVLPSLKGQSSKTEINVNINERKLAKAIAENQTDSVRISNLHELADYVKPNLRRMI